MRLLAPSVTGVAALLLFGCSNNATVLTSSVHRVGMPASIVEEALRADEVRSPGIVEWSRERRYDLNSALRVVPTQEGKCRVDYVINRADRIVGFNMTGPECRFGKSPSPW